MDKLKQWVALAVVGMLAVLAGGWFLVVSPKRGDAKTVRTQVASQVSANGVLAGELAMLKAQGKELPKQQAKLAAVAAKIPDNPALPSLIRALTRAADNSNVELVSMTPSVPVAATSATTAAVAAPTGTAASSAASTAASAPAGTAGTLQQIALTINVVGGYFQIEQYFDAVESITRALKVKSFTLAPGTNPVKPPPASTSGTATATTAVAATLDGSSLTANINAVVYMATGRTTTAAPVAAPAK